jgi:two-component system chemotaxis sensor kinase CheA
MVFRGEMITLIFLDEFFGIPRVPRKKRFVVFAGVDEEKVGLVVDSLVGRREIVIKSLDKTFMDVRGFAGATVLGDGQVSLILDIPALMDQSRMARESLHIS